MQGSGCIETEKENNQIRKKKLEDVQNVQTTLICLPLLYCTYKELVALYKCANEKTIEKVFLTFAIYD